MKNRFRSKAPPGGPARVVSSRDCLHSLWALVVLLCFPSLLAAQIEQPPDLLDRPAYTLEILAKIQPKNHPGFGRWTAPLGDINNDGYDDFAVSTLADTTFIFLGGDPLDHEADFFVLGGAMGICAGDFNGDGLVDLVTARGHFLHRIPNREEPSASISTPVTHHLIMLNRTGSCRRNKGGQDWIFTVRLPFWSAYRRHERRRHRRPPLLLKHPGRSCGKRPAKPHSRWSGLHRSYATSVPGTSTRCECPFRRVVHVRRSQR
jgi:hypothetical protein